MIFAPMPMNAPGPTRNPAGQSGGRADVGGFFDLTFVIDDGGGVDDHGIRDPRFGANDRAGGDDDVLADGRGRRNACGGMDRVDQIEALFEEHLCVTSAGAVVADRHNRGLDLFRFELWKLVRRAKDRQAANARAGERSVGVDETDGIVFPGGEQDVEHDLPMSAGAEDQHVHGVIIGPRGVGI